MEGGKAMQNITCLRCGRFVPAAQFCFRCSAPLPQVRPLQAQPSNKGWWHNISWQAKAAFILGVIAIVAVALIATMRQRGPDDSKSVVAKTIGASPDFSNPERLNVSEPSFSTSGVGFTLDDKRPNKALWISIKVGSSSADKSLMTWLSSSGVRPGLVAIPYRECKYLDAGIDSLARATQCEATIGARLEGSDKIVFTTYKVPVSEMRRALLDATR